MAESTFDVVSDYDKQELVNAIDQASREVNTRYDLKDTNTQFDLDDTELTITSDNEMAVSAACDILQTKALRRGLSIKIFDFAEIEEIGGMRVRQVATLQKGLSTEMAKKIQKLIKKEYPKVNARVQGDAVRVGSKNRDDLQSVIATLKEQADEFPVPLQFTNYR